MKYALVPKQMHPSGAAHAGGVTVWIGAFAEQVGDEPAGAELCVRGLTIPVTWAKPNAHTLALPVPGVYRQEIFVPISKRSAVIELSIEGKPRASAVIGRLERLPPPGDKPLTILLGSCYGGTEHGDANLGRALAEVCDLAEPDLKFLCGDQVYLDHPARYTWRARRPEEVFTRCLAVYRHNWSERGLLGLLRQGATYLSADDHEFWNEYPAAWGRGARGEDWERIAQDLFGFFQGTGGPFELRIDPLSFMVLDTRMNRSQSAERFTSRDQMEQLRGWVGALNGPGVLVISEPLFGERWSLGGTVGRWFGHALRQPTIVRTLPEYDQYGELSEILAGTQHSIVVLAGDVHWGRIAHCTLPNGAKIIEIVSSPLTLSGSRFSRCFRPWTRARSPFGSGPRAPSVVTHDEKNGYYQVNEDHFVTLELSGAEGGSVDLKVRLWRWRKRPASGEAVYFVRL